MTLRASRPARVFIIVQGTLTSLFWVTRAGMLLRALAPAARHRLRMLIGS
jgi:hypothetical protein